MYRVTLLAQERRVKKVRKALTWFSQKLATEKKTPLMSATFYIEEPEGFV